MKLKLLALGFSLALPITAHAAVIFNDSFEADGSGTSTNFNVPNTASSPAWNATFTGVTNTTPGDSNFNSPNGGPTFVNPSTTTVTGQDGTYFVTLGNLGGSGDNCKASYKQERSWVLRVSHSVRL